MVVPQHPLLSGQDITIKRLGLCVVTLRLDDQCQIARRYQSARVIWSQDAAVHINQLTIKLFGVGVAGLIGEISAQVAHRSQYLLVLWSQSPSSQCYHLAL